MKVVSMRGRDSDGPSIHLNEDHLHRLGIDVRAGDEVEFHGRAKVRHSGESDDGTGVDRHSHMEVTHLGAERKGAEPLHETLRRATGDKM